MILLEIVDQLSNYIRLLDIIYELIFKTIFHYNHKQIMYSIIWTDFPVYLKIVICNTY